MKNKVKKNKKNINININKFKPLTREEDVLDDFRNRIPKGQEWGCYSFISDPNNKISLKGFLCSGSFATQEDAQKHADEQMKNDNRYNIFVGQNGLWCPFDPDPNSCKDAVYQERQLNEIMIEYLKQNVKQKEVFEQRKHELMKKAIYEGTSDGQKKLDDKDETYESIKFRFDAIEAKLIDKKRQLDELPNIIKELELDIVNISDEMNKLGKRKEIEDEMRKEFEEKLKEKLSTATIHTSDPLFTQSQSQSQLEECNIKQVISEIFN
jgi:hypothetical protein